MRAAVTAVRDRTKRPGSAHLSVVFSEVSRANPFSRVLDKNLVFELAADAGKRLRYRTSRGHFDRVSDVRCQRLFAH